MGLPMPLERHPIYPPPGSSLRMIASNGSDPRPLRVSIPAPLNDRLTRYRTETKVNFSDTVRIALAEFFERRGF